MRVACVMMQRNEELCLHPWLAYHGYLFGFDNLFVLDHGSDLSTVKTTLTLFERFGVHVLRLPASANYAEKGAMVSAVLGQADAAKPYDLLFPLDCDELVMMRDEAGQPSCEKASLLRYLATLRGGSAPLLVSENFLNSLNSLGGFWALPYQKVFFTGGHVVEVDHGSHSCVAAAPPPVPPRRVSAPYHPKPYAMQQRMSREKLRPYVDVDDKAALEAFRGVGWHLVLHLLKSEDEYRDIMTGGSEQFPALPALLERLGVNPRFAEG